MKRIGTSSKLIAISSVILIALLYSDSSFIYAKEDPSNITSHPHDFNKFVCGTRADHSLHSQAKLIHAENLKRISDLQLTPAVSADFDEGDVAVMVDDGTLLYPEDPFPVVDAIAIFNKFYETHDDIFDQVVLLTNFTSNIAVSGFIAFSSGISNSVQGINIGTFDFSASYGSAGRLQSYLNMNELNVWFDDPFWRRSFDGNSFLTFMGQEAGHRWLSFLRFDPGTGVSDLILGRSLAHWSTFLKFELTSTMDGGNNWVEIAPNTFENKSLIDYFSNLDQYAMGLRAPEEVPPFYYISSASNNTLAARAHGTENPGARATGTRVNVTIEEVIAAEGLRIPARDSSQKDFQQAFILLVQQGTLPSDAELDKAKRFVAAWKDYWVAATDGRSTMSTNLDTVLDVAVVKGIVADASTNQPIENIAAINLATGVNQTVAAGGYYTWRTLADSVGEPDGSFTQVIGAYPYFPDTSVVPVTFNSTISMNISLTKLPTGSVAGTITNSNSGASIEALVVLHAFSEIIGAFDIDVRTDGSGGYSFADLYVTHPGVISYEGITVYPDFPNVNTEIGEIIVEDGITTTVNIGVPTADVLLVNDDPSGNYPEFYTRVFDSLEVTYHEWRSLDKGAAPAHSTNQLGYPIIVWFTGDADVGTISKEEEDSLMAFLDGRGNLFITGQNIIESLSPTSPLLTNYLQVSHGGNSSDLRLEGVAGNQVTSGLNLVRIRGGEGADNQSSPDILIIGTNALEAIKYGIAGTDVAGVTVDSSLFKIFLTGFGFESLSGNIARVSLMFRVLTWFGIPGLVSVDDEVIATLPKEFSLGQNYPNPFNPSTSIDFTLSQDSRVRVSIYNLLGQKVKTLVDADKRSGIYTVEWNGLTETGRQAASGLYFYRLEARHKKDGKAHMYVDVKKMLLLR